MKKSLYKKGLVLGIIVLFVGASIIPTTIGKVVKITTFTNYNSGGYIQGLIDNASDGDTINIPSGTYYENIIINKSISLIGEDKDTTIIDGGGDGDVVYVSADWVNINGFTIQNSGDEPWDIGISIESNNNTINDIIITNTTIGLFIISWFPGNNIISENIIKNNNKGIYLSGYWNGANIISGNFISTNTHINIELFESSYNVIKNNIIIGSENGLGLSGEWSSSTYNIIENNSFFNTGLEIDIVKAHHNLVLNNEVNGKPLVFLEQASDLTIDNAGQIYLINCDNITVNGLDLSNTTTGIRLYNSNNCFISNNHINSNYDNGIYLTGDNNLICNNIIKNNKNHGIYIIYCLVNNTITGNTLQNNICGIELFISRNVTITNNTLFNNGLYINENQYIGNPFCHSIENNTVNGKPLIYLQETANHTISNAGQVILAHCNNIVVENLNASNIEVGFHIYKTNNTQLRTSCLSHNRFGTKIYFSNNNSFIDNNITINYLNGIYMLYSHNNIIQNTAISSNKDTGIFFYKSNRNIIKRNNISKNEVGILIKDQSNNNSIYHNNFLKNMQNAYDEGDNNTWDDGKYGNYWSDYKEKYPDAKKKRWTGIWDTPYEIEDGDNKDNFPLINKYPKSVIKSKSIYIPFNYNFPVLSWLFENFPNSFPILRFLLGLVENRESAYLR